MKDNPYDVQFLPMTRNGKEIATFQRHSKLSQDDNLLLAKGKYDIDYVIRLLKTLSNRCEHGRFDAANVLLAMRESLKKLLAMLEIEKNSPSVSDPIIQYQCQNCKRIELMPRSKEKCFLCPCLHDYSLPQLPK